MYARNDSKQETSLIGPFIRKKYQNLTLEAINLNIRSTFSDNYFLTSFLCLINRRIFHSVNYNRKGNLNNFTVSFKKNSKLQFGESVEFFKFNIKIFAIIKKFKLIDHEEKIFFEFNRRFRDHLYKDLFLKFYRIVDIKQCSMEVVDCNDFILRCL